MRRVMAKIMLVGLGFFVMAPIGEAKKKQAEPPPVQTYDDDDGGDEIPEEPPPPSSRRESKAPIGISGGVGIGDGYLAVNATVSYGLNQFMSLLFSGFFRRETQDNQESTVYGPETAIKLFLPNPTIVTPFVGAGPGYANWKRVSGGEVFDERGLPTASVFGGIDIKVTRRFSIEVMQKSTAWMGDPPKRWENHELYEPKAFTKTEVGFIISI